jgi:hypothetical protein
MAAHLRDNPVPIRTLRPDVPPALEAVVLHALRRNAASRYQGAAEIVADLSRLGELDPAEYDLSPERPLGGMAAAESARRLWALVALIAVSFVGIVAVIITLSAVLR